MESFTERFMRDRPPFKAPAVYVVPELGELHYVLTDATTVTHPVDTNLEILRDASGDQTVGVKITNLPALLDAILTCGETRAALRAMADQRGITL